MFILSEKRVLFGMEGLQLPVVICALSCFSEVRITLLWDSPVPGETGFTPMKYAYHFMGQAFHGAGKPGNDGCRAGFPAHSTGSWPRGKVERLRGE
jgi:hypothetical protein